MSGLLISSCSTNPDQTAKTPENVDAGVPDTAAGPTHSVAVAQLSGAVSQMAQRLESFGGTRVNRIWSGDSIETTDISTDQSQVAKAFSETPITDYDLMLVGSEFIEGMAHDFIPEDVPRLLGYVTNPNLAPSVRMNVIGALIAMDEDAASAVVELEKFVQDETQDPQVLERAKNAILTIPQESSQD